MRLKNRPYPFLLVIGKRDVALELCSQGLDADFCLRGDGGQVQDGVGKSDNRKRCARNLDLFAVPCGRIKLQLGGDGDFPGGCSGAVRKSAF
ncbi:hypothetical protein ACFSSA_07860 [Luteolibacter algae]|uniref:Uncharacterized protein n=1 Tax=Luteolibacter algae TaxID=454151 RepID=A0ABW5D760_9BACT